MLIIKLIHTLVPMTFTDALAFIIFSRYELANAADIAFTSCPAHGTRCSTFDAQDEPPFVDNYEQIGRKQLGGGRIERLIDRAGLGVHCEGGKEKQDEISPTICTAFAKMNGLLRLVLSATTTTALRCMLPLLSRASKSPFYACRDY